MTGVAIASAFGTLFAATGTIVTASTNFLFFCHMFLIFNFKTVKRPDDNYAVRRAGKRNLFSDSKLRTTETEDKDMARAANSPLLKSVCRNFRRTEKETIITNKNKLFGNSE